MYSRKRDKKMRDGHGASRESSAASMKNRDPSKWVLKNLEEIDEGPYHIKPERSKVMIKCCILLIGIGDHCGHVGIYYMCTCRKRGSLIHVTGASDIKSKSK